MAELDDGLLHFVEALLAAEKKRKVEPRFRVTFAEVDVLVIFPFGGGGVFFLFGDARINPVFAGRIHSCNGLRLCAGLLLAAADDAGCYHIELRQIEPGIHVFRIQLYRALEFSANLSGQILPRTGNLPDPLFRRTRAPAKDGNGCCSDQARPLFCRTIPRDPNLRARNKRGRAGWTIPRPPERKRDGHSTRRWPHRPGRPPASPGQSPLRWRSTRPQYTK